MKTQGTSLTQEEVDKVRFDVICQTLITRVNLNRLTKESWGEFTRSRDGVQHLRFLEAPDVGIRTIRSGNPPPDVERQPWEKRLRLEIDIGDVDPVIAGAVRKLMRMYKENKVRSIDEMIDVQKHTMNMVARRVEGLIGYDRKESPDTPEYHDLEQLVKQHEWKREHNPKAIKLITSTKSYRPISND